MKKQVNAPPPKIKQMNEILKMNELIFENSLRKCTFEYREHHYKKGKKQLKVEKFEDSKEYIEPQIIKKKEKEINQYTFDASKGEITCGKEVYDNLFNPFNSDNQRSIFSEELINNYKNNNNFSNNCPNSAKKFSFTNKSPSIFSFSECNDYEHSLTSFKSNIHDNISCTYFPFTDRKKEESKQSKDEKLQKIRQREKKSELLKFKNYKRREEEIAKIKSADQTKGLLFLNDLSDRKPDCISTGRLQLLNHKSLTNSASLSQNFIKKEILPLTDKFSLLCLEESHPEKNCDKNISQFSVVSNSKDNK